MNTYDKAIQLLKIRPHYSAELAKKLGIRGFPKLDIEKVINQLTEEELLNDAKFIQLYTEELIRNKTFGFYGLKAKLMQRGIPGNDADRSLKENLSIEKEIELAMKVVEREAGSGKSEDKIKLAQKLQRKGFRGEVIRQVIGDRL